VSATSTRFVQVRKASPTFEATRITCQDDLDAVIDTYPWALITRSSLFSKKHNTWQTFLLGDWIIADPDGGVEVMSDRDFRNRFEIIGDQDGLVRA
jgi:hypothetical protein